MNPKQGLSKQTGVKGQDQAMNKWPLPSPQGYTPENAPAKPKGGATAPSSAANKHANTPSGTKGLDASIKSRF